MTFKIGFTAEHPEEKPITATYTVPQAPVVPRKSVVQVYFAGRNLTLAYYNDRFDLKRGDVVYVDGKLEGMRGRPVQFQDPGVRLQACDRCGGYECPRTVFQRRVPFHYI